MPPTEESARPDLAAELEAMWQHDQEVRAELAAAGSLFDGYHPRMEQVHRANAARLREIIEAHGWPGRALVGVSAARAAFGVLNHAIGEPALQRLGLELLEARSAERDVDPIEVAMLADRIAFFEGRPQRYGTQFDWDDHGELRPWELDDADGVDSRRAAVGLPPLAEQLAAAQAGLGRETRPDRAAARRAEMVAWARSVGWRD